MKSIVSWVKKNPVRTMALATAIIGATAIFLPAAVVTSLLALLSAVLGIGIHEVVTPVTTMVEKVTESAVEVAKDLDETVVGTVGELTDTAESIVNNAVNKVLGKASNG